MVAALSLPRRPARLALPEQRILINGVRWEDYVLIRERLDTPSLRMTYLRGSLEIMSPSQDHEESKAVIARLIGTYAFLLRLRLNGYGSTTFRKKAKERGAEPDECWTLDRRLVKGEFPDIVLEVIETSPLLDKLDVYDGFAVPEVWLFEAGAFALYRRRKKGGYDKIAKSAFLPQLDFELIAKLAKVRDQQDALEALEKAVRPSPKKRRPARRP